MRAKFCPKCKNSDLIMVAGGYVGMWRCKKCGFSGAIFPERKIVKNENKKTEKGFGRTDELFTQVLLSFNAKGLFKSFGVQSWVGGVGERTGLISQRPYPGPMGSRVLYGNPIPGALTEITL